MKTTTRSTWLPLGVLLFAAAVPAAIQIGNGPGRGMGTGSLGRCRLFLIPGDTEPISFAAIGYEENQNSVTFTIEPTESQAIEVGDIAGNYFTNSSNTPHSAPIDPDLTTEITFTFTGNTVTVSGQINGDDDPDTEEDLIYYAPTYVYPKRGESSPLGGHPKPSIVDFGNRLDGSPWQRARVMFEYYGLHTGFSVLDWEG